METIDLTLSDARYRIQGLGFGDCISMPKLMFTLYNQGPRISGRHGRFVKAVVVISPQPVGTADKPLTLK